MLALLTTLLVVVVAGLCCHLLIELVCVLVFSQALDENAPDAGAQALAYAPNEQAMVVAVVLVFAFALQYFPC